MRTALRRWSITGRLTALYALSALVMLSLAAAFLYWSLERRLAAEDEQALAEDVAVIRAVLEKPGRPDLLDAEIQRQADALPSGRSYARLQDRTRRTLLETPGMGVLLPARMFPAAPPEGDLHTTARWWRAGPRRSFLLMSARAAAAESANGPAFIQVARDMGREEALVADYGEVLGLVVLLGVIFSAAAGFVIARRGLRPVGEITAAAARITAARLHERIAGGGWPSELSQLAAVFDDMLARLEDSFRRLSQFSADLAHELRTPVGNLVGEAEVALARARTPDEYRQVLESALEEYARLSGILDSLLFLARAESGRAGMAAESIDLKVEAEAVCEFYRALAEEQGVELGCSGEARAWADPALVRRALGNLLANAIAHTSAGGRIAVHVEAGDVVSIRVTDTGCGIAPEHLPRVFDRFYRADAARSSHPDGSGLGLALVRSIAELHGGSAAIESLVGRGTTVVMNFPATRPQDSRPHMTPV